LKTKTVVRNEHDKAMASTLARVPLWIGIGFGFEFEFGFGFGFRMWDRGSLMARVLCCLRYGYLDTRARYRYIHGKLLALLVYELPTA